MRWKEHGFFLVLAVCCVSLFASGCTKLRARDKLNKGVYAYRSGQFDEAIEDFKEAKGFDPTLTSAQLYLATAYASEYVPGAPSPDNIRNGEQAVKEFQSILETDPNNLSALDGAGSILYNMAGTPFDPDKMAQSKTYHQKHIQIAPSDPEPYYWIGVIDWSLAYRNNRDLREGYNEDAKKQIKESDPMPPALSKQFSDKSRALIDEGVTNLQKAIELKPDYDDAMAYLNLLYRQQADTESAAPARDTDLKLADELVDKVKAIKLKKLNAGGQPTS